MKEWMEALQTSRALDDRRDRHAAPQGQARVDEALSNPTAATWTPAPPGLRARVMDHVRAAEPQPAFRMTPPLRAAAYALAATVVLGLSVGVYLAWPRPPAATPQPAPPVAKAPSFDTQALTRLPVQAEPMFVAMEQPFVEEARLIQDDTRRAVAGVFARLPTRISR